MQLSRRHFISSSGVGLLGASFTAKSFANIAGANDRIVMGFIGLGGMGQYNLKDFLQMKDVTVAAVCDVWEHNLHQASKLTESQPAGKAREYSDFRRVIELKDIDAVLIATPDHWHALPAIRACEAGKDVYVEKPLAYCIREGRKIVDAARQNKRVTQMGTQQRSGKHYAEASQLIQQGRIGKISRVAAWNYGNDSPLGIGNPPDANPPSGLNWDMYLGAAPVVPFNPNRFILNFRWFWDYAGGMMTDWGVHHIDAVHMAMGVRAPKSVCAFGRKFFLKDNRQTPDTLEVTYEYPEFILTYSSRFLNNRSPQGRTYGIEFFGTDGTLFLDRSGYEIYPETRKVDEEPVPPYLKMVQRDDNPQQPWERERFERDGRTQLVQGDGSDQHLAHVRNFLDCVKSRQQPVSNVEEGHRSTTAAHLGNISLHTGRKIQWDAEKEEVINDPAANKLLTREYRKPWEV
ncbi:MAG: Gfo/Idh/MocA family oxidoreductase [Terriglobia bacterium]